MVGPGDPFPVEREDDYVSLRPRFKPCSNATFTGALHEDWLLVSHLTRDPVTYILLVCILESHELTRCCHQIFAR